MGTVNPGVAVVAASANPKLTRDPKRRPVIATHRTKHSCPADCPFFDGNGCYADAGMQGHTTRRLTAAPRRSPVAIARLQGRAIRDRAPVDGRPMRVDIVGDDRTPAAARITGAAVDAWRARGGGRAWKYTHAWRAIPRDAWGESLSVLASVESPRAAVEAMRAGYAAAIVVDRFESDRPYRLSTVGHLPDPFAPTVIPCPAQTRGLDCERCGLCTRGESLRRQGKMIGFEAHGSGAARVRDRLRVIG